MTCRELVQFLDDYVGDTLPSPQRRTFEEHLAECEDCEVYLGSYRTTVALAKRAGDQPVPADVPERLIQAILAARRG